MLSHLAGPLCVCVDLLTLCIASVRLVSGMGTESEGNWQCQFRLEWKWRGKNRELNGKWECWYGNGREWEFGTCSRSPVVGSIVGIGHHEDSSFNR